VHRQGVLAAGQTIEAGCTGVAVVSALFDTLDIKASAHDILSVSDPTVLAVPGSVHLLYHHALRRKTCQSI
jgi:hypothetical protein